MNITVLRYGFTDEVTLGMLFIDGIFECYTLEDAWREKKIYGATCIPEGTYEIQLRTEGGFHQKYMSKFEGMHKGMLQVMDVPNYTNILIHIGNTIKDTAGCLLVGNLGFIPEKRFVGDSTEAYKRIYQAIVAVIKKEKVFIEYKNLK